jgi:hypothetical protein
MVEKYLKLIAICQCNLFTVVTNKKNLCMDSTIRKMKNLFPYIDLKKQAENFRIFESVLIVR